jgi:hypothetical protein
MKHKVNTEGRYSKPALLKNWNEQAQAQAPVQKK